MEKYKHLLEHYIEKKQQGTDYSVIRRELETKGLSKEEIKEFIREVDKIVLETHVTAGKKGRLKEAKLLGYVLLFGGGFVTVGSYFGLFNLDGVYIIAWGPILVGYFMILSVRIANKKRNRTFGGARKG